MMPILTIRDAASNHNGGDLASPDGYLYLSLATKAGEEIQFNTARFINKNFPGPIAAVLRGRPHRRGRRLPGRVDQPESALAADLDEPSSASIRAPTGSRGQSLHRIHHLERPDLRRNDGAHRDLRDRLLNPLPLFLRPADGSALPRRFRAGLYEEVNLVNERRNYGWSWCARKQAYFVNANNPPRFPDNSAGTTNAPPPSFDPDDPIFDYGRADNGIIHGNSICGGIVYRGNSSPAPGQIPRRRDTFGGGGIVAAFTETSPGLWTGQRLIDPRAYRRFRDRSVHGEPLLCSLPRHDLADHPVPARAAPRLRNPVATGAFSNTANLTPGHRLVAYERTFPSGATGP